MKCQSIFLILLRKYALTFMQIVSSGNNLHEMSVCSLGKVRKSLKYHDTVLYQRLNIMIIS